MPTRVNCWLDQLKIGVNTPVARFNIRGAFWWLEMNGARDNREMRLNEPW